MGGVEGTALLNVDEGSSRQSAITNPIIIAKRIVVGEAARDERRFAIRRFLHHTLDDELGLSGSSGIRRVTGFAGGFGGVGITSASMV
jgi:hypothetical protein